MTKNQRPRLLALAAASLLTTIAAHATPDDFQDGNAARFDALEDELTLNLTGRSVGYGFAVYRNETFQRGGGGGFRRVGTLERPSLPFSAYTRKGCHSMSKAITAAAMLRALQFRNISLDWPIYPYLPKKIQLAVVDDKVKEITFRDILSHRSGIPESGWGWSNLLQGAGTVNPNIGNRQYANWNYAVCRTLIPYVLFFQDLRIMELLWPIDINAYCADIYADFVQSQILQPAGIPNATWKSPENIDHTNFSYYYNFTDPTVEEVMPDRLETLGSGGWAMSANGYARFMSKLQSGTLLQGNIHTESGWVSIIDTMRDSELGMFDSFGQRFYDHSGANTYENNQDKEYGGRAHWVHDSDTNITVCVQVNSVNSFASGELYSIITTAIRNAFDSTTTTSAPIPPEDLDERHVLETMLVLPVPAPAPPRLQLREPVQLSVTRRAGQLDLSFPSVPGTVHVIETLEDGLWVPTTALPGDGSTVRHTPATRRGTALFRVTTVPTDSSPTAPEPQ